MISLGEQGHCSDSYEITKANKVCFHTQLTVKSESHTWKCAKFMSLFTECLEEAAAHSVRMSQRNKLNNIKNISFIHVYTFKM